MKFLVRLLLCLTLVSGSSVIWAENPIHLIVLHVNDTHGKSQPHETNNQTNIGGIARLSSLVKNIRQENPKNVLFLHAGDIFSRGDPVTVYYGGHVNLLAFEKMGVDAITPGNGEFYFGIDNLQRQTARVSTPFVHANVTYKRHGGSIFPPYLIKNINGVRIGILGLGLIRTHHHSSQKLELGNPIEIAKKFVPELRPKVDFLIALTHIGVKNDTLLAKAVPELDLIVGGDSHTQLDSPLRFPRANGKGEVAVVQARHYFEFLGRVDVKLDKTEDHYAVAKIDGRLIPIDAKIESDPEIEALRKRYGDSLDEVICRTEIDLPNLGGKSSPLGDLVAKAVHNQTRADLAILYGNSGFPGLKAGDIRLADVSQIRLYHGPVATARLTGVQIEALLSERFFITSGCQFDKVENHVTNLMINGKPADPAATYLVATEKLVVFRSAVFDSLKVDLTGQRVDTALEGYLRRVSVIQEDDF